MNTIIIIIINKNKFLGKITTNLQPKEKKDGHKSQGEQQPSERTVSRLRCWRVQRYREAGWELGWPVKMVMVVIIMIRVISYLIFVTGATGGARVNFFWPV